MTGYEFARAAHPHRWLLVPDDLYEQSIALYHRFSSGKTTYRESSGTVLGEWPSTSRATFLLAGFALEKAIKSFLVYGHPAWVSNGVLARSLRSHELVVLSKKSSNIPWQRRRLGVLARFEDGLQTWARYPCALHAH